MAQIFVKPRPGMLVNSPDHPIIGFLPEEGAEVENSIYWRRRIADGDVEVLAQSATEETDEKTETSKGKK